MKTTQTGLSLEAILSQIRGCRICRDAPVFGLPLPHEPRPIVQASRTARICIVGQAPGLRVQLSGRPFTDASGARLKHWLSISDDDFYNPHKFVIAPMGFCFPGYNDKGGDLPPRRECAPTWHSDLLSRLDNIALMVLVGTYAQRGHLGQEVTARGLTSTVKDWRRIYRRSNQCRTIPLPHPSWRNSGWLKRNPWFEMELLPVLRGDVVSLVSTEVDARPLGG
jgi:uracil-DNA glycosylase